MKNILCPICNKNYPSLEVFSGHTVRASLAAVINKTHPSWSAEQNICLNCLNSARSDFVEESLIRERGALSDAELDVMKAIRNQELIASEATSNEEEASYGARISDKIAAIGGSWKFIISFGVVIFVWITINSLTVFSPTFDPYPYILLNLVLSCLAALQAPIIMMSQNRQEIKDRFRAEADYKTNLKAELEIRHLHMKLDQLVSHQWHRLLEIQQIQLDMMADIKKQTALK